MMADEPNAPPQNWRLLVVAFALGLIVMIIYNLHINQVRKAGRGNMIQLVKANQEIEAGKLVTRDMLAPVDVPMELRGLLGAKDAIEWKSVEGYADGQKRILRKVMDGVLLRGTDFTGYEMDKSPITYPKVGFPLPVDPRKTPGELLTSNSRINVFASIPTGRAGQLAPTRILRNARVVGIGERAAEELADPAAKGRTSFGRYTKVTIELTEELSEQLNRVLATSPEPPWIELMATTTTYPEPELTPAAKALLPAKPPAPAIP